MELTYEQIAGEYAKGQVDRIKELKGLYADNKDFEKNLAIDDILGDACLKRMKELLRKFPEVKIVEHDSANPRTTRGLMIILAALEEEAYGQPVREGVIF